MLKDQISFVIRLKYLVLYIKILYNDYSQ